MDNDVVIRVEGLHKKFCRNLRRSMFYGSLDVSRDMFGISRDRGKLRPSEFFALEGINFELKKGEALGIIGQNGSGKTTLLRIINGIFPPDKGKVQVRGRMSALIAVGAGFHPHMTGRENIYLNGTILGMSRKEIDEKFQEIIDFADIGEFIDAPVSTYSSGMTVRLGFSIAIHSDSDILLADEILAVGDLNFALKCHRKIAEYREKGGAIILVSHGMQLIRNTCQKVIWIESGKIRMNGITQNVCDEYEKHTFQKDMAGVVNNGTIINNDPQVRIDRVEFFNRDNVSSSVFIVGDYFKMRIHYDAKRNLKKPIITFGIINSENILVVGSYSNFDLGVNFDDIYGNGYIDLDIKSINIKPGNYYCTVTLLEETLSKVIDWHEKNYSFTIEPSNRTQYGIFQPEIEWQQH